MPYIIFFAEHYALANTYAQQVMLHRVNVPTIHGFQCPTVQQDAEQNAILKTILFSPWRCTDPMQCGSVLMYKNLLSDNSSALQSDDGDAPQLSAATSPPSSSSRPSSSSSGDAPQLAERATALRRSYTFKRAWTLRHSEILVLAARADCRCDAAKKRLVLADTTAFAELKEPKGDIDRGEEILQVFRLFCLRRLQRTLPTTGARLVLAFLDVCCRAHPEQCSIAEFSANICRDDHSYLGWLFMFVRIAPVITIKK